MELDLNRREFMRAAGGLAGRAVVGSSLFALGCDLSPYGGRGVKFQVGHRIKYCPMASYQSGQLWLYIRLAPAKQRAKRWRLEILCRVVRTGIGLSWQTCPPQLANLPVVCRLASHACNHNRGPALYSSMTISKR